MQSRPLDPGVVEVWWTPTEHEECRLHAGRYLDLLCDQERQRHDSFRFERHRHLYRVSHALVRNVLSKYCDVAPESWRFARGVYGRPEIATGHGGPNLRFSLSHTMGLAVCAVSANDAVGVDAECLNPDLCVLPLADRALSELEREDLIHRDGVDRVARFIEYWTLREAYLKAVGAEIPLPARSVGFRMHRDREPTISFDPFVSDDAHRWCFHQIRPSSRHHVAVALCRAQGRSRVGVFRYVP